jgi:hypothetical protein
VRELQPHDMVHLKQIQFHESATFNIIVYADEMTALIKYISTFFKLLISKYFHADGLYGWGGQMSDALPK